MRGCQQQLSTDACSVVFYLAAGILLLGSAVFLAFARGDAQSWNEPLPAATSDERTALLSQPKRQVNADPAQDHRRETEC